MLSGAIAADILAFWFTDASGVDVDYRTGRKRWFRKSAAFDQQVRQRFEDVYHGAYGAAIADPGFLRRLDMGDAASHLALTLLFDQLPRNMFRRTPAAFAADPQARAVATQAIDRGLHQALPPLRRMFFYFPLEHSESVADQASSVDLFAAIAAQASDLQDSYDYALRHQRIIQRFGRFPHRNSILGRRSTAAEVRFLKQPGSSF
ncbi:MAG: DUF924 family protein [Cyanobacteria bacterium P01_A01_bin.135]